MAATTSTNKFKEIRFSNFLIAGCASTVATVVTNPIEVRIVCAFNVNVKSISYSIDSGYQNKTPTTRRTGEKGNLH